MMGNRPPLLRPRCLGFFWMMLLAGSSCRHAMAEEETHEEERHRRNQNNVSNMGPAIIQGKNFYDAVSGAHIPIKGVAYYPRPNAGTLIANNIDFFTDQYAHIWRRDIEQFVALNVNTIRLFAVDPSKNHDAFMCALQERGIRVLVSLSANCVDCAIGVETSVPDCYPAALKTRGQYIIAAFSQYENVLGFEMHNEISLNLVGMPERNAPCGKQFLRDMRAYIRGCPNMRQIPIGLATADRDRQANALYYNCRSDPDDPLENAEWYGINAYQHCDGTAETIDDLDGFKKLRDDFASFELTNVPVILTEFGCINPSFPTIDGYEAHRDFLQVSALFSTDYVQLFAGGCVFEYSNEDRKSKSPWPYKEYATQSNFGVGYFAPEFCNDMDVPCEYVRFPQFDNLARAYANVEVDEDDLPPPPTTVELPDCPAEFPPLASFTWESAAVEDRECPEPVVLQCPGSSSTPPTSTTTTAPMVVSSPKPTTAELDDTTTKRPTAAPNEADPATTRAPTDGTDEKPTSTTPTMATIPTMVDDDQPTRAPSAAPPVIITLPSRLCADHTACSALSGNCCPPDGDNAELLLCCGPVEPMCAQNPACAVLMQQVGECCPTPSGFFLDCCTVLPGECYVETTTSATSGDGSAGAVASSSAVVAGAHSCTVYSALQYQKDLANGLYAPTASPLGEASAAATLEQRYHGSLQIALLLFCLFLMF
jgi:1,3-beta-glucanosyltransferase GAS5